MLTDDERAVWQLIVQANQTRIEETKDSALSPPGVILAVNRYLAALEAEHRAVSATLEAWYQGEQAAGLTPYLIDVERAHKTVDSGPA